MPSDSSYNIGQSIGAKIRAVRLEKKYTQGQLAHPEFSVSYISAIERGQIQPSLRALELLAKRLGLTTGDLLYSQENAASQAGAEENVALKEIEQDLLLLETQVALHQKNPEQAIGLVRPLFEQQKEPRRNLISAYLLGLAYLEGGHLEESEQVLAKVIAQAKESSDPLYARLLAVQSAIYSAMRNTTRALHIQYESLACCEACDSLKGDIFFLARVYSTIGQYYHTLGQFERALEFFRRSQQVLGDTISSRRLKNIYSQIAHFHRERAEIAEATLYDYKWFFADLQSQFVERKGQMEHALGHALLKSSSEDVYAHLTGVLQESKLRSNELAQASANVHLATWLLTQGKHHEAEPYAHEAREKASTFGDTIILAEALLLQGKIAYMRQDYLYGDQCFQSGLTVMENLNACEDLIEHLADYARLLEKRGNIQKALIYWKRAYEYQQKIR